MSTLEEFQEKIQETRKKLSPLNTPQKNQALLQFLKEFCAHTLEHSLDPEYEEAVKEELLSVEHDIRQYKMGLTPASLDQAISEVSEDKQEFERETELPPSAYAPVTDARDMWQSVPIGAFDPNSSPIMRRLLNNEPISGSRLSSSANFSKASERMPPSSIEVSKEIPEENNEILNNSAAQESVSDDSESAPNFESEINEIQPFPESLESFPAPQLRAASIEISQLKLNFQIPWDTPVYRFGKEDLENQCRGITLTEDFLSPILSKQEEGSEGPLEHFVIEQTEPGKFILKDRTNQQKTYFKGTFVSDSGVELHEGDNFIIPVLIKNQLSSLTLTFHID